MIFVPTAPVQRWSQARPITAGSTERVSVDVRNAAFDARNFFLKPGQDIAAFFFIMVPPASLSCRCSCCTAFVIHASRQRIDTGDEHEQDVDQGAGANGGHHRDALCSRRDQPPRLFIDGKRRSRMSAFRARSRPGTQPSKTRPSSSAVTAPRADCGPRSAASGSRSIDAADLIYFQCRRFGAAIQPPDMGM